VDDQVDRDVRVGELDGSADRLGVLDVDVSTERETEGERLLPVDQGDDPTPRDRSRRWIAAILLASSIRGWSSGWMIEESRKNSQTRLTMSVGFLPVFGRRVTSTQAH
jgi:hypothetical protein